jgi:hypothetical protein
MKQDSCWLIEDTRASPYKWLRIVHYPPYETKVQWSEYASLGLRFCRKEDAEMFWLLCPQPGVIPAITEHVWIDGSKADGGAES